MAEAGPFTGELENLYRVRYRHFLRVATAIVGDEASGHDAVQEVRHLQPGQNRVG